MKARQIKMLLKSIRTKLIKLRTKYKDLKRLDSHIEYEKFIFKELKEIRDLIQEAYRYEHYEELEDVVVDTNTYLQISTEYRDLMSSYFNRFEEFEFEQPKSKYDYVVYLSYLFLYSLETENEITPVLAQVLDDIVEKGYISPKTEKLLEQYSDNTIAKFILENYRFEVDKGYRQLLNEFLNILKYAYITVEKRYDLETEKPTKVIQQLYEKGDIKSVMALKKWITNMLYQDYLPAVGITIADILSYSPERINLIAWYVTGVKYRGKHTNFITLDSFNPDDRRLGEILEQINEMYNQGKTFTEIVNELYPDKSFGEVISLIIHIVRR